MAVATASGVAQTNNSPPATQERFQVATTAQLAAVGASIATMQVPSDAAAEPAKKLSAFEQIWGSAQLYKNDENPVIQSFNFTGRFQLDYAVVDSDQGNHDEWNIRRFRVGGKAELLDNFTFHSEVDLNPQEPPVYSRVTDLYLSWSQTAAFRVTVGKQSAGFTMDGRTSSKELLAIDRSNLSNNLWFPEEYVPGASFSGNVDRWLYKVGAFSAGARNGELGEFNGGYFGLASLGYDFSEALDVKTAVLWADYVYQEPDRDNTFTRSLQHIASLNFSYDTGHCGVRADLSAGEGFGRQSNLWGAMVMPFYNITDKFQVVGRYTFIDSDDFNGVRLARYESEVVSGRGDEYHEAYLGLNYYLYGHKLKLQTGINYADMKDNANDGGEYSGWGWTTGLRVSW